ncbi:MAG: tRNA pseudouridine(13) synthase TruD [Archaeoglobaceae archaeon]|nr:tRNA pseudouridine(13) synthase TruD [Archaeoglobaceae archaeon]MCX8151783.1 tRNA pseudouridine(13) synthase TruD [Archaeoglobaceae archaeon]MDW8013192.1 tRNA pseudouridine(13) synthase TruD [Archaeoglobaceae archaeon]
MLGKFITSTPPIGGEIKVEAEDFYVEEIAKIDVGSGDYAIIKVKKMNWDTLRFANVLASRLKISKKRISFAGTKDKRALTVQYFSVYKVGENELNLKFKDAEVEFVGYSRKALELGDLVGNKFKIVVRNCKNGELFSKTLNELKEKGTPNYFGLQRFGVLRYVTHEVGKLLLQKNYEEAFWTYVAKPFEGEDEKVKKIREDLWNTRDPRVGLRELPKHLSYERSLLQKLREGKSELEALLSLPRNLKIMFIHAYQSYIFNRLLSDRIKDFGNLKEIYRWDYACYLTRENSYFTFKDFSLVDWNFSRVKRLIAERFAALALPLVGYDTKLEGWNKKAKEILSEDNLDLKSFKNEIKEFSSPGSLRAADMIIEITGITFSNCTFSFYLPKGCYGTVLLREFLKKDVA